MCGLMVCSIPANAATFYAIQDSGTLLSIDSTTFDVTTVGSMGIATSFGDLAYDSSTQTLYALGGRDNAGLYTVNTATGAATLVGMHNANDLFGLAFDSSTNTLYGTQFATARGFFTLNQSTGAATFIATMSLGIGGLTYNSDDDELVGTNDGSGQLYSIDRATGAQTFLASPGNIDDSDIVYDPSANLYYQADYTGNFYVIDPSNDYARTLLLEGLGNVDGLELVGAGPAPVPEPSTWALITVGLAVVGFRRRAS